MIDLLLRFPDRDTAVAVGRQLGVTSPAEEDGGFHTIQADHDLAVRVIGEHMVPTGTLLTDSAGGEYPELVGDGCWWVMIRSLPDQPVPAELQPYVVTRDDSDPAIPNDRWA